MSVSFSEEDPDFNFTAEIATTGSTFLRNVGIDPLTWIPPHLRRHYWSFEVSALFVLRISAIGEQ